jgi:hypothetical protein
VQRAHDAQSLCCLLVSIYAVPKMIRTVFVLKDRVGSESLLHRFFLQFPCCFAALSLL